jgi:glutamate synthase (NADPH/NADH) large chain
MDRGHIAIPALLARSAIHQHLVNKGLRTSTGLVVETGSAREVHHFAPLGGYGAEAVHPYLALETLIDLARGGQLGDVTGEGVQEFRQGDRQRPAQGDVQDGHLDLYAHTAPRFEAVGLSRALVERFSPGPRQRKASACSKSRRKASIHQAPSATTRCWTVR